MSWRGALLAGALADAFGMAAAIAAVGILTTASGVLVAARMPETLEHRRPPDGCVTYRGAGRNRTGV